MTQKYIFEYHPVKSNSCNHLEFTTHSQISKLQSNYSRIISVAARKTQRGTSLILTWTTTKRPRHFQTLGRRHNIYWNKTNSLAPLSARLKTQKRSVSSPRWAAEWTESARATGLQRRCAQFGTLTCVIRVHVMCIFLMISLYLHKRRQCSPVGTELHLTPQHFPYLNEFTLGQIYFEKEQNSYQQ